MSLLDALIPAAHAQAAAGTAAAPNPWLQLVPLILLFVVFWFLLIRPQMKRQKEHRQMVDKLAKGDEVVTSGGIAGRIDDVGESFLTVEIADGTKVKLQKGAVSAVLPKGTLKSL
ncbi:MAG: preprotein translocase subunit YajC [Lysobacteraceae bacterium]|jgi:preprotein translocase subunit YajC|nr:preprotein translocase subunit YajC [Xanthomonadaceae bacterium]MCZ8317792.1 preprotein translocase subunit YajC [Silanimonas sp.]